MSAIHRKTGIAKRLTRNEYEQYSHAVLLCGYSMGCTLTYTKQRSVMSFHPSGLKLAISFFRTKAKNAFYMSRPNILLLDTTKICFLPEHDALFKEFFYLYVQFGTKIQFIGNFTEAV